MPSVFAKLALFGFISTISTMHPGIRAVNHANKKPNTPAPTIVIRSPTLGVASHSPFTTASRFAARTARLSGTFSGKRYTAFSGTM